MTLPLAKPRRRYNLPCHLSAKSAAALGMPQIPRKLKKNKKDVEVVLLNYATVPKDIKGWVDAALFCPIPYDLCNVLLEDGRRKVGWWTGAGWTWRTKHLDDRVVMWRRTDEET